MSLVFHIPQSAYSIETGILAFKYGAKAGVLPKAETFVNGEFVEVPENWAGYDQANREDFFGAIPVSLPLGNLKETVTVELSFPDDGGHVSSVVLLTESIRLD